MWGSLSQDKAGSGRGWKWSAGEGPTGEHGGADAGQGAAGQEGSSERNPRASKGVRMQAKEPSMCREKAVCRGLWFLTI